MSDAVILGLTGIVVSGVIGPAVAAWLTHRAELNRFRRDQVVYRRDQLKALLEDAAVLSAKGPTNLRVLQATALDSPEHRDASEWLREVFPIGQRLQLWLPGDHAAIQVYDSVREALVTAAKTADLSALDAALTRFDALRSDFLDEARSLLLTPYSAKGDVL